MDELKKKRRLQRSVFTRELNSLSDSLNASDDVRDVQVSFEMLEEKMTQLSLTTDLYMEHLLTQTDATGDVLEKEIDEADLYKRKYLSAKYSVQRYITSKSVQSEVSNVSGPPVQVENRKTYTLPKIELCKFGGDVKEWLQFWSLFKKYTKTLEFRTRTNFNI